MRKRIGVFMGEVTLELQENMLKGIIRKSKDLGYDAFVFCNFGAYGDNVLYAEGEKAVIQIPDISMFDGIIVGEDTFDIDGMGEELYSVLKKNATCPVVYLKDPREGFYNVKVEQRAAIEEITRHLVEEHGVRDVCFMSGTLSRMDAQLRYQGFLDVMMEKDIPIHPHMMFEGDFWVEKGKQAIDWFMEGRETYPQAIVCANDYMALSVCDELRARGLRVPEDVCVTGYDDILEVRRYQPAITSFRVPFVEMGVKAVEMIDNVCNGRSQDMVEWVKPTLQLRESCGCATTEEEDGSYYEWLRREIELQKKIFRQSFFMSMETQDSFEEDDYYRIADKYFAHVGGHIAYVCLCEEDKGIDAVEKESCYSDFMVLRRIFDGSRNGANYMEEFDRKYILPERILEENGPEGYLVFPIHYKNKAHGYFVTGMKGNRWVTDYTRSYLTVIASAIENEKMHREIENLEIIKQLYHKDSLTGILNRRGFEKQLRVLRVKALKEGKYLGIVSIDMNGLKQINDTYGHPEGDDALRRLASVLKRLVGENEICARVGGDEFSLLLFGDTNEREKQFREAFPIEMQEEERRAKKPYPFSASYGICSIDEEKDLSLTACLQLADDRMYAQKKKDKLLLQMK
ncbi:MAG: GGDEF domain-containing protein [Lachnospiraceae bacterium]|nr:GGDEF domain-containing protein [Lachnospiraceae bacterium]